MSLLSLAKEVDESDGAKRSMALSLLLRAILQGSVNDETSSVSMGPVNLDVEMARAHGWSKEQIDRAWSVLEAVARSESEVACLRHPELYETDEDGESHFVGDESTDATCSKCGMEFRYYQGHSAGPGAEMLLAADGVHVGYNLAGADYKEPEIVCETCGSDSGL